MKYGIAIMAGIMFTVIACKEKEVNKTVIEDTTIEETATVNTEPNGPECYLKVVGKDSMIFQMERAGDSVHGVYNWKPLEKDSKLQKFKGILVNGQAKTLAISSGEGMTNTEELNFTVANNTVAVKSGEMEEAKDGVWRYKAGTTTSDQILQKVDCPQK
jgi:hypothetical protein